MGRGRSRAVLLHGLAGSADSAYIVRFARRLVRMGVRVVRMNLRGAGQGLAWLDGSTTLAAAMTCAG